MSAARLTAGGAVASALGAALSWICCLPFVLAGLGAGTAGLATVLAPWRAPIVGLSLVLILAAFYFSYRRTTDRRAKLFFWLAATVTVVLITVPYWLSWAIYWSL